MKELTIKEIQERIWKNKLEKGFNTKHLDKELLFLTEELGEVVKAHRKDNKEEIAEEIIDIIIYSFGILKMLNVDAYKEIVKKMKKNEGRQYKKIDGHWRNLRKDQI